MAAGAAVPSSSCFQDIRCTAGQQMRQQLRTIQENADIEERHEAEVQIQELIRTGQFRDAIDLAEEIIHGFPARHRRKRSRRCSRDCRIWRTSRKSRSLDPRFERC